MQFKKGHIYFEKHKERKEQKIVFLFLDESCFIDGFADISSYCHSDRNPIGGFCIDTNNYAYEDLTPELK